MKKLLLLPLSIFLISACATNTATPTVTQVATGLPPTAVPATIAPTLTTAASPPTQNSLPTPTTVLPTNTVAPTVAATLAPAASGNFVPLGQSVWEVPAVPAQLVGTCKSKPLTIPYGLIAITQSGNGITLRDQGVGEYTLAQAAPNVFAYNGASNITAGTLEMTITFTSATSWRMRSVTVLKEEPTCQHVHNYQAVFKWVR